MNDPFHSLQGKLILVTGGGRGIGKAISELLAAHGAGVLTAGRSHEQFPAHLPASSHILPVPLDVTQEPSVLALFNWLDQQGGHLHGLVNNAGIGVFKPLTETTLEEWQTLLTTNLTGSFLCMREAAGRMARAGGGRIVQIGSISDHLTLPDNGAYAASKFGVRALVGVLNEELKHKGVFCSLVSPGATLTEIWKGRSGFNPDDMIAPEEIARTVADILSRPSTVRIDEVRILPRRGVL